MDYWERGEIESVLFLAGQDESEGPEVWRKLVTAAIEMRDYFYQEVGRSMHDDCGFDIAEHLSGEAKYELKAA